MKLDEVWQYRDLVVLLTKKTFMMTYQQTILGPLWIILNPVLSSLTYMFIFQNIARIGTDGIPQILFYFVSSSVWELFAFSLRSNANTFVTNVHVFSKVYFPRLAVPLSNMLVSLLKFTIQLGIIAVLMAVYLPGGSFHPLWAAYPLLPLLFLQMSFLGMSVGVLLSGFTTRYRDLVNLVSVGVNLWMYGSAVVYPLSALSEGTLKTIIRLNPVTPQMELIRRIMLGAGETDLRLSLFSVLLTIVLFLLGTLVFNHVERTFADRV